MPSPSFQEQLRETTPRLYVTPLLIGVNVAVFAVIGYWGAGLFEADGWLYVKWGANYGPLTASGQWQRLLTHAFLHFGIVHLALNMWVLFEVGRLVERLYGPVFFALIYLGAAITGGFASLLWHEHPHISVGASGAIFGVYGALLAYLLIRGDTLPRAVIKHLALIALVFVGVSMAYGLLQSGIDNAAHIGGLAGGCALGLICARPLGAAVRRRRDPVRLLLGLAGLSVLSVILASLTPKPVYDVARELDFNITVDWFRDQERAANTTFNHWVRQAKSGKLEAIDFARQLERQPLAYWQAIYQRLQPIDLTRGSPSYVSYRLLLEFSKARRDALLALIDGLRHNDSQRLQQFHALQRRAEDILDEINRSPPNAAP